MKYNITRDMIRPGIKLKVINDSRYLTVGVPPRQLSDSLYINIIKYVNESYVLAAAVWPGGTTYSWNWLLSNVMHWINTGNVIIKEYDGIYKDE